MRGVILSLLMLAVPLYAKSLRDISHPSGSKGRPQGGQKVQNIGRVWSALGNQGSYGDPNSVLPTYDWPGGTGVYYQWEGRFWLGAEIDGVPYVSHADYGNYEFSPSEDGDWVIKKPGVSMFDIECKFDDWDDMSNQPSKQLGVKIIQTAMQWSVEGFDDFIAYEYKVTYDASESFHGKDTLEFYMSWIFDADVGGRISTDPHLDDLVGYDGNTHSEWPTNWYPPDREIVDYPYDKITLNADGTIVEEPDSVLDQFCVFGDEPDEKPVHEGDTLRFWRNFSYIYDGDNVTKPGDDEGEQGQAPGYICGIMVYAPPSSIDSVWTGSHGEPCRLIKPFSHQWWNWQNDPGTDEDKLLYITGKHPFSKGKKFMMHPFIGGAPVFDYRFMHTYGTYKIADGDTLEFVFVGFMGFGLNGGVGYGKGASEGIFQEGKWYPGARWVADQAIKAYYMGSASDPVHPSAPSDETHWLIPIPPEVPYLTYSASRGKVSLAWTDIAEQTPDPIDGEYDFRGYRIYRCEFKIGNWKLIGGCVDADFAASQPDSCFPDSIYDIITDDIYPHTYVDSVVLYGIPYFYAVTAFDAGRTNPKVRSLASGKVNYKKDDLGAEISTYVKTERRLDLERVVVAPNPYIGSAGWEVKYQNKVQFMNLPGSCRILIYTVSGDLVRELIHRDATGDEYWDMESKNEQSVVSGLYVYKIEAEDQDGKMMRKLGKLVVIR